MQLETTVPINRIDRFAPWIVSLWLVATVGYYAWITAHAILHPPNPGDDLKLAGIWLAFVAAVVVTHAVFRHRLVTLLWLAALGAVGILMIIRSHQFVAALITVWLLTLAWTWGDWLIRLLGAKRSEAPLEWVCLTSSIGLVLLSLVGLTLLIAHRMSARWTWIVLLILTLFQSRSFFGWFKRMRRRAVAWSLSREKENPPEKGVLLVLVTFIGLFNLAWALAPEIMYDSLSYHLAMPKEYLAAHRLVNLNFGYHAHLVETIYTLALALHGQIVAKLLVLAMGVITTLGVYALGRKVFNQRVGLWAAALVYSTPLVSWLSGCTYIDLIVSMFLTVTMLAFLRWRDTRKIVWLLITGFLGGAAVAAKLNALFGLPVIGMVVVWDLLRIPQMSVWSKVKGFAGCGFAASLVSGPYFLIVYIFTGNPFFPLLHGIFSKGSFAAAENLNSDAARYGLGSHSLLAPLRLPLVLTFDTQRLGTTAGAAGICLMLLPLALILFFLQGTKVRLLFVVSGVYLILLGYTVPIARYYIPILPMVAVLASATVVYLSGLKWIRRVALVCLGLAVVAQTAAIPIQFWQIPERFPLKVALGSETAEAFLSRALVPYRAVHYLNGVIRPGEKIMGFDVDYIRFYLNAPLASSFAATELNPRRDNIPAPTLAAYLAANGYAYLMLERPGPPKDILSQDVLDRFSTIVFTAQRVDVYRLTATPTGSEGGETLLSNPGFETLIAPNRPADWEVFGHPRIAESSAQAHAGKVAVQATERDGFASRVPVKPGEMYLLGHWSRADRSDQFGRLQINWLDASGQIVDVNIDTFLGETTWSWHQFFVMAPARASFAHVYVSAHGDGEVWFDDYVFRKITNPNGGR